MSGLPWADLMRLGLGRLNLKPDEFWNLTPVELMLMAGQDGRAAGCLTKVGLDALLQDYPDTDVE